MPAKPYSPSHIAAVAGGYTELRLSGAVKAMLVEALCAELDRLVPQMEAATLAVDEERKTLDDPRRSRLNYNRTRELMIDRIKNVESVGSAAVQAGIDHLEQHLGQVLRHAAEAAERDRVATIKPRHLDRALLNMKPAEGDEYPDMECVKIDAVEKPCCGIDPAKYRGGSCFEEFDKQSKAKPFQKRSVALEHEKSCTFTPVIDCGCGWKPKQEATLKCTNGNTEVVDCEKDESVIAPGERMDGLTSPEADGGNRCLRERIRELAAADQIASIAELDVSRVTDFSGAVREQTRSRRSRRLCRE